MTAGSAEAGHRGAVLTVTDSMEPGSCFVSPPDLFPCSERARPHRLLQLLPSSYYSGSHVCFSLYLTVFFRVFGVFSE